MDVSLNKVLVAGPLTRPKRCQLDDGSASIGNSGRDVAIEDFDVSIEHCILPIIEGS